MLSLLEVAERSQKGPRVEERDWSLGLFRRLGSLAKKYELRYPGGGLCVNTDDSLALGAFEAAVEFLSTDGVYCQSTGRVIHFSEQEVRQAAREAPSRVTVGEGRDQRVISQKQVEGKERLNQCPGHHAPFSEEVAPLIVKNYAQIPTGDFLEGINFAVVDGREIFGPPIEAYAARRELAWMREGVRKAGRPGMAVVYYPINTRAATLIAPMDPDYGLRRTDGILLTVLTDMKVEHDMLTAAMVYEDYGSFKVNGGGSGRVGGFCGGTEGAILEAIAKPLAGWLAYHDSICNTGVFSTRASTSPTIVSNEPNLMWGCSVVFQALTRHSNLICFCGGGAASGPGTRSSLIEQSIRSVIAAVNGANLYVPRQLRGRMNAAQVPLTAEWAMEVADATIRSGITRERSQEVLGRLYQLIAGKPVEQGAGHVSECYDLVNHRPTPEFERIYLSVKEELAGLGLAFE